MTGRRDGAQQVGIDWIELDAGPAGDRAAPGTPAGALVGAPVARPLSGRLAAACLLLAAAALVCAGLLWRARSAPLAGPIGRLATRVAGAPGMDALGCPLGRACRGDTGPAGTVRAVALREFPGAQVVAADAETDVPSGRLLRVYVAIRDPAGTVVSVTSQCVPNAHGGAGTAAPQPGVGPVDVAQTTQGAPGCTVTVTAHVPAGVAIPASQVAVIALDGRSQLRNN